MNSHHIAQGCGESGNKLSLEQVLEIGEVAMKNQYLKHGVEWYQLGMTMISLQKVADKKMKAKLSRSLADSMEVHDRHIMTEGMLQYDARTKNIFHTLI